MTYQVLVFQLCVNFSLVLIAKRLFLQIGAKKRRGRDAHAPFLVYQIPHIYVISQAMPHATPKTHSSFYPHRM